MRSNQSEHVNVNELVQVILWAEWKRFSNEKKGSNYFERIEWLDMEL